MIAVTMENKTKSSCTDVDAGIPVFEKGVHSASWEEIMRRQKDKSHVTVVSMIKNTNNFPEASFKYTIDLIKKGFIGTVVSFIGEEMFKAAIGCPNFRKTR